MGDSLPIGGAKMGMDVRLCAPKACWPEKEIMAYAEKTAATTGARLTVTENVEQAVKDCDFLYTDVWLSMGEPEEKWAERITLLTNYQCHRGVMTMNGDAHD